MGILNKLIVAPTKRNFSANFRAMSFTIRRYQQNRSQWAGSRAEGMRSARFNFFIELFDNTLRRVATPGQSRPLLCLSLFPLSNCVFSCDSPSEYMGPHHLIVSSKALQLCRAPQHGPPSSLSSLLLILHVLPVIRPRRQD
jgi:hypothetical protein